MIETKNQNNLLLFAHLLENPIKNVELMKILETEEAAKHWDAEFEYSRLLLATYRFLYKLNMIYYANRKDNELNLEIERPLSERQRCCALDAAVCINNGDIRGAYHELYDCVRDSSSDPDRMISIKEYLLFKKRACDIINMFDNKLI